MYKHDTASLDRDLADASPSNGTHTGTMSGGGAELSAPMSVRGAPRLTGSTPSDDGSGVSPSMAVISLSFSEYVSAGSGYIFITDGSTQTYIDRSGKASMRVVGATDTKVVSVSDSSKVSIVGNTVQVHVSDLIPSHNYNVIMAKGAFVDLEGNAFGGITSSGKLNFTTGTGAPPVLQQISLDKTVVGMGATITVTAQFSEAIDTLDRSQVLVSSGSLSTFTPNTARTVWTATFTPDGATNDLENLITIPGAAFRTADNRTGLGATNSPNYVVDTYAPFVLDRNLNLTSLSDPIVIEFSEAVTWGDASTITLTNSANVSVEIQRTQVTLSSDGLTLTIPASVHKMAVGEVYSLTLPPSIADVGINQLAARTLVVGQSLMDDMYLQMPYVTRGDETRVRFWFTADVHSLDASAFTVEGGTLSDFKTDDGYSLWSAKFTPNAGEMDLHSAHITADLSKIVSVNGAGFGTLESDSYIINTVVDAWVDDAIGFIDNGVSSTDAITRAPSQSFSGTYHGAMVAGEKLVIELDDVAIPTGAYAVNTTSGSWTYNRNLTEGYHQLSVWIEDSNGNRSHVAQQDLTVDLTAPKPNFGNTRTGFDPTHNLSFYFDEQVNWDGSGTATLSDGSSVINLSAADLGWDSTYHYIDLLPAKHLMVQGKSYTLTMPSSFTDLAGNAAGPVTITTVPDSIAPTLTKVQAVTADGLYKAGDVIAFDLYFSEAVHTSNYSGFYLQTGANGQTGFATYASGNDSSVLRFEYTVDSSDEISPLAISSLTTLASAVHDLALNDLTSANITASGIKTAAGSPALVAIDGVAPNSLGVPSLADASNSGSLADLITNDATPTVSGSGAVAGATVRIYDDTALLGSTTADSAGKWSYAPAVGLTDGFHYLSASQLDAAGNESYRFYELEVQIDTVAGNALAAPDLEASSDLGISAIDNLTADVTPTFVGTGASAYATIKLYAGNLLVGSEQADGSGAWSVTSSALTAGAYNLTVTQTDLAGNTNAASTALAVTIDTTAPAQLAAPDLIDDSDTGSSTRDDRTGDGTPTFSGTALPNTTVNLLKNGTVVATDKADSAGLYSLTAPSLASGAYSFTVTQMDDAGNVSTASDALAVTIDVTGPVRLSPVSSSTSIPLTMQFDERIYIGDGAFTLTKGTTVLSWTTAKETWSLAQDGAGNLTRVSMDTVDSTGYYLPLGSWTVTSNGAITDEFGNPYVDLVGFTWALIAS